MLQFKSMNKGGSFVPVFHTWLRGQMEARGWDQAQLARESGLAPPTINNIFTKPNKKLDLDTYIAIAKALRLPPVQVLEAAGYAMGAPMSAAEYSEKLAVILQVAPWFRSLVPDLAALPEDQQKVVVTLVHSLADQNRAS